MRFDEKLARVSTALFHSGKGNLLPLGPGVAASPEPVAEGRLGILQAGRSVADGNFASVDPHRAPEPVIGFGIGGGEFVLLDPLLALTLEHIGRASQQVVPGGCDNGVVAADGHGAAEVVEPSQVGRRELLYLNPAIPLAFEDVSRTFEAVVPLGADDGIVTVDRHGIGKSAGHRCSRAFAVGLLQPLPAAGGRLTLEQGGRPLFVITLLGAHTGQVFLDCDPVLKLASGLRRRGSGGDKHRQQEQHCPCYHKTKAFA